MTVLRDVRGLGAQDERAVLTWAARALVESRLAEAESGTLVPEVEGERHQI